MSRTNGPVVLFGGGPDQPGYTNETFTYSSRSNEWEQVSGRERDDDHAGHHPSSVVAGFARGRQLSPKGRGFAGERLMTGLLVPAAKGVAVGSGNGL